MKGRIIVKGVLMHCFQRSAGGNILFYNYSDYLVYFTGYCVYARKYGIQVLSLCLMPDHIHDSLIVKKSRDLEGFKRDFNTWFSKVHKPLCHCWGPMFESPFGSAPKRGEKKARTNLIYVGNNPVERHLCSRAEEYRWNFLSYAQTNHPFSAMLIIREASWNLRLAIKEVNYQFKSGKPMAYAQLQRLFKPLNREECLQLTDYIVARYNVIDYAAASRFFDSYNDMIAAMHSNTGSEYDINEPFLGKSDVYYTKMSAIIMREKQPADIHDILGLTNAEKYELFLLLRKHTAAMGEQIAKYLRMPIRKGPMGDDT